VSKNIKTEESGSSAWEGNLCRIRHFRRSDAMAFFNFAKLPEVSHFMSWEAHTSLEVTKRYLDSVCRKKGKIETPWAIVTQEDDHCCGFVSFCNYTPEHRRADFAIALSPAVFGRGIAQEASRFLLVQAKRWGSYAFRPLLRREMLPVKK
jgi:RimJ/RimL family protein N-acetyltransferase